ncbi:MAG: two-component system sensor histidine kinase KdbD, partial [Candidatus Methylomirabilis sp.]|nr:two-component system sensor histidine kinase KdbD [Deltaproteobacteria bacterium]
SWTEGGADEKEAGVARWVFEHGRPAGFGTDTLPSAKGWHLPLRGSKGPVGVLAVALAEHAAPLLPSQRQLLETFVSQTALALERAKLAEEAASARLAAATERQRSALLSTLSHDLRTPLAAVTGAAATLLQDGGLPEDARRELLEAIREEADRLGRLVADLLELTRLESGTIEARKEWQPLEEVVGSALQRVEPMLGARDVKVDLPDAMLLVPIDAALLEHVFVNVLENAAKYTPPDSPIEVRARADADGAIVEVLDRGPGIPPEEAERIFDKFYRLPGEASPGTGLGLTVSRAIVQAHGGRMWVERRPGGGAAFRFTLPFGGAPPEPDRRESRDLGERP